jgi:hypothetical protein
MKKEGVIEGYNTRRRLLMSLDSYFFAYVCKKKSRPPDQTLRRSLKKNRRRGTRSVGFLLVGCWAISSDQQQTTNNTVTACV